MKFATHIQNFFRFIVFQVQILLLNLALKNFIGFELY